MTPRCISVGLALALVAHGLPAPAQFPPAEDPPAEHKPLRPPTRETLARREARTLYGLAVLRQQNDRLLEAVKLFEEARALDAKAAPVHRGLMTLYAALGRSDDALAACRAALDLDPGDHETWYGYARQLRLRGRFPEARDALRRAAACPSLVEHPDAYVQAHYDLSTLHEDLQEYDQAVAALAVVLGVLESPEKLRELETPPDPARLAEQAAGTYERIIRLWIQAGRRQEAVAAFKQAVAKHGVLATRLNLQMAKVQIAQGQLAEALLRLDDHLRTQPVSTEGYELKAAVLTQLGRSAEVLPMLDVYARRDPHNLALQLLLGRQYARVGPFEQAEKFYQDLLDKHEAAADVYRGLFTLYRERNQPEKVFHALNQTLTRAARQDVLPGDARAAARGRAMLAVLREDAELGKVLVPAAVAQLDRGRTLHADTAFFLAALAARAKQLPGAERLFRYCLEAALDPPIEVAVYDGLLRVLWESRKYDGVVWLCERGLRQAAGANRLLFHVNLARALALQGKAAEALAEAERAVAAALDDDMRFAARLARLRVLWHVERHQAALAECQTLLKERLQPAQARDVRQLLSGIYSTLKDYPKAEEQLQVVLKDDPNDATACNDLGYLWADQGKNLDEAERLIRKALDLDREQKKTAGGAAEPDNAAFLDSLGWVLFRKGDAAGARVNLEKAAALPDGAEDPVVWDHLGDVYSQEGDAARAGAAYRRALDLYEKDGRRKADNRGPEIRRKLQQLGAP